MNKSLCLLYSILWRAKYLGCICTSVCQDLYNVEHHRALYGHRALAGERALICSMVKCSAQSNEVQCNGVQFSAVQCSAVHFISVQCRTIRCGWMCSAVKWCIRQSGEWLVTGKVGKSRKSGGSGGKGALHFTRLHCKKHCTAVLSCRALYYSARGTYTRHSLDLV